VVVRLWRGWTSKQSADEFVDRVRTHLPVLGRTPGLLNMQLLRHDGTDETEFVTVTCFASMAEVIAFAGPEYSKAVIPESLGQILIRVEPHVRHYDLAATSSGSI